jgi:hypothetical protein
MIVSFSTRRLHLLSLFVVAGLGLPASARTLLVDQRGHAEFSSIAAAVKAVAPGDTIKLAPGSGPYREIVNITTSGAEDAPITLDGSGEVITGADPLTGFRKDGEAWVCDLAQYYTTAQPVQGFSKVNGRWTSKVTPAPVPFVVTYRGERLLQDSTTGQFTRYAKLSDDRNSLVLLPGTDTEGWEISVRSYVVKIETASHQVYRHIRATGSLNDGFNIHGDGRDLIFEDIEAFNNLDEGFSAHDTISCTVTRGRFYRNDNGLTNANQSFMNGTDIVCRDNLGFGLYLQSASGDLDQIDCGGNGVGQLVLHMGATVTLGRVTLTPGKWTKKPWLSSQESGQDPAGQPLMKGSKLTINGNPPILLNP